MPCPFSISNIVLAFYQLAYKYRRVVGGNFSHCFYYSSRIKVSIRLYFSHVVQESIITFVNSPHLRFELISVSIIFTHSIGVRDLDGCSSLVTLSQLVDCETF